MYSLLENKIANRVLKFRVSREICVHIQGVWHFCEQNNATGKSLKICCLQE